MSVYGLVGVGFDANRLTQQDTTDRAVLLETLKDRANKAGQPAPTQVVSAPKL